MEKDLDLSKGSVPSLVVKLESSNSWTIRAATRAIIERADPSAKELLNLAIFNNDREKSRLVALWALSGLKCDIEINGRKLKNWTMLDGRVLDKLAKDPSSSIRSWAALLSSGTKLIGMGGPPLPGLYDLVTLAADPAADVRRSVALVLRSYGSRKLTSNEATASGEKRPVDISNHLMALSRTASDPADKTLPFLIWMALEPQLATKPIEYLPWLSKLAPTTKPLSLTLTYKSARRITDTRSAENMDLLLKFLDDIKSDDELVARALDGMLKAQEAGAVKPAKTDPAPFFAAWAKSANADVRSFSSRLATIWGDPNAIAGLMGLVLDEKADEAKRIDAIQTVRRLKSDAAKAGILKLLGTLDKKASEKLTVETLRAAAELGGMDLATAILKAWSGYSPALKSAAAEVMISRADWAEKLLDAVEGKWIASQQIPASEVPVTARRYFAKQPNADQKARAEKLLGVWNETNADTKALITAKRKASLTGTPDLANGKVLFTATCATCHKFHGGGQEVGPELIGSGRSSLDALLNNIIDPNQIIGNGYENVIINTKDSRTLAGRVVEDTPTQVTLLGIGGRREVVARGDISKLENTHQSLMPNGFGALPDDAFRDLMWYILAPPEEGPLSKEKIAAISAPVTELTAAPAPKDEKNYPKIDLESVSLWNPEWKVTAPEFEGTPVKLGEFSGRKNILQMHPFPDKTTPSKLSRKLTVDAIKPGKLKFSAASKGDFDWELRVNIDGKEAKRQTIGPKEGRWHEVEISLEAWKGKTVEISLENHANGWAWEFSYWHNIRVE
jgi:putative heme-binding domain-containing protein